MGRFLSFACVGLLSLAIAFGLMWKTADNRLRRLVSEVNRAEDAPFEQAAISLKAQSEHVPTQKVAQLNLPVTVHFSDRRCVELRPKWGVVGGSDIYCFDAQSRRVVEHQNLAE
jgi:hypothetical protein